MSDKMIEEGLLKDPYWSDGVANIKRMTKKRSPRYVKMNQFIYHNGWTLLCVKWIYAKKISYIEIYDVGGLERYGNNKQSKDKEEEKTTL